MSAHLVINYAFQGGRGGKVQRKWGERGTGKKKVWLCQKKGFATRFEGFATNDDWQFKGT